MSKTLPLVDHLLRHGRHLQSIGLNHRAKLLFQRLAGFRELPREVAEETQHRLAELHAAAHEYAFNLDDLRFGNPLKRETLSIEADEACPDDRALTHYRQAARLEPDNSQYLCDYGLLAIRLGQVQQGLKLLRQAQEATPNDLDVLDKLATGLDEAGETIASLRVLRTAMFRNSGDRRYRELYRRRQFQQLSEEQARRRVIPFPTDEPVLIPFFQPATPRRRTIADGRILRLDTAEGFVGPRRHIPETSRKKQI